jgi:hypothetical protein
LSTISNDLTIETDKDHLILSVNGDFADQTIKIKKVSTDKDKSEVTKNLFNIKYLLLFTKSSNLCSNIEIYLKSKFPLIILYNVANLGQLKFCLAPKQLT